MAKCKEYLELFKLDDDATEEEIKRAYKQEALRVHPDKNPDDPDAKIKFQKISEAYTYLMRGGEDEDGEGEDEFFEDDDFLVSLLRLFTRIKTGQYFSPSNCHDDCKRNGGGARVIFTSFGIIIDDSNVFTNRARSSSRAFSSTDKYRFSCEYGSGAYQKPKGKKARKAAMTNKTNWVKEPSQKWIRKNQKREWNLNRDDYQSDSEEHKHSNKYSRQNSNSTNMERNNNDSTETDRETEKVKTTTGKEERKKPQKLPQPVKMSKKEILAEQSKRNKEIAAIALELKELKLKEAEKEEKRLEKEKQKEEKWRKKYVTFDVEDKDQSIKRKVPLSSTSGPDEKSRSRRKREAKQRRNQKAKEKKMKEESGASVSTVKSSFLAESSSKENHFSTSINNVSTTMQPKLMNSTQTNMYKHNNPAYCKNSWSNVQQPSARRLNYYGGDRLPQTIPKPHWQQRSSIQVRQPHQMSAQLRPPQNPYLPPTARYVAPRYQRMHEQNQRESRVPTINVWAERENFSRSAQPNSLNEEQDMLMAAIRASQLQAEEDQLKQRLEQEQQLAQFERIKEMDELQKINLSIEDVERQKLLKATLGRHCSEVPNYKLTQPLTRDLSAKQASGSKKKKTEKNFDFQNRDTKESHNVSSGIRVSMKVTEDGNFYFNKNNSKANACFEEQLQCRDGKEISSLFLNDNDAKHNKDDVQMAKCSIRNLTDFSEKDRTKKDADINSIQIQENEKVEASIESQLLSLVPNGDSTKQKGLAITSSNIFQNRNEVPSTWSGSNTVIDIPGMDSLQDTKENAMHKTEINLSQKNRNHLVNEPEVRPKILPDKSAIKSDHKPNPVSIEMEAKEYVRRALESYKTENGTQQKPLIVTLKTTLYLPPSPEDSSDDFDDEEERIEETNSETDGCKNKIEPCIPNYKNTTGNLNTKKSEYRISDLFHSHLPAMKVPISLSEQSNINDRGVDSLDECWEEEFQDMSKDMPACNKSYEEAEMWESRDNLSCDIETGTGISMNTAYKDYEFSDEATLLKDRVSCSTPQDLDCKESGVSKTSPHPVGTVKPTVQQHNNGKIKTVSMENDNWRSQHLEGHIENGERGSPGPNGQTPVSATTSPQQLAPDLSSFFAYNSMFPSMTPQQMMAINMAAMQQQRFFATQTHVTPFNNNAIQTTETPTTQSSNTAAFSGYESQAASKIPSPMFPHIPGYFPMMPNFMPMYGFHPLLQPTPMFTPRSTAGGEYNGSMSTRLTAADTMNMHRSTSPISGLATIKKH